MQKNYRRLQVFILIIDVLLMYVALVVALVVRRGSFPPLATLYVHFFHFSIIFIGWIIVFYTLGLYRLERPFDDIVFFQRMLLGALIAGLASAGYFYLLPGVPIEPKTVLFLFVVLYTALFCLWRYSLAKIRKLKNLRVGVGFIELQPASFEIIHETLARSGLGYDICFVFDPPPFTSLPSRIRKVDVPESVRAVVEETNTDLIILADDKSPSEALVGVLFSLLDRRVRFMRLSAFYELV
ncbi:MAG TPA: hypothetical protein PKL79_10005, partial [Rectinema sp.]|nr:hypothetical protein [Rectinema sp.]